MRNPHSAGAKLPWEVLEVTPQERQAAERIGLITHVTGREGTKGGLRVLFFPPYTRDGSRVFARYLAHTGYYYRRFQSHDTPAPEDYVADDIETALLCCVAARKLEGERV